MVCNAYLKLYEYRSALPTCIILSLDAFDIWLQSVEEAECRRAYDSAAEVYLSAFDRTKQAEEVS